MACIPLLYMRIVKTECKLTVAGWVKISLGSEFAEKGNRREAGCSRKERSCSDQTSAVI